MRSSDPEKQRHFDEKARLYEEKIRACLKKETAVLEVCRKEDANAALLLWELSNDMLNLVSYYLAINGIFKMVFEQRDEESLTEARKAISKAIIYIENVVTGKVDAPFSEYEENLAELSTISVSAKFSRVKKIGCGIDLIKAAYGDNTKWRWSFVDIEGRFVAVAKNLLNAKKAFANNDPSDPDYEPLLYHLNLVKDLLYQQAHRFQERFSLATKRADDVRLALNFLSALRQFHIMLNEQGEAEEAKRKYDAWETTYQIELNKIRSAKQQN